MSEEFVSQEFAGKRVALCVSGGIAAYKAAEVLRGLQRAGCGVRVAMTKRAAEFITPLTFRALSGAHVVTDDYAPDNPDPIAHITFAQTVDLLLVAPATANIIAKFANGIADDFVTSTYLASTSPVLVAPAMNTMMWNHPATQRNLVQLRLDGVRLVEPAAGEMACGTIGTGRLSDPQTIVRAALQILRDQTNNAPNAPTPLASQASTILARKPTSTNDASDAFNSDAVAIDLDLSGEHILITAGATREDIDPVRFISNRSSGRMGFALAEAAHKRGANVTVVAGATIAEVPPHVRLLRATSADAMRLAVMNEISGVSVFIAAAAVADYKPATRSPQKIKKSADAFTLTLEPTPDILAEVAQHARHDGLIVVGFAAESTNVLRHAREKLQRKNLDMIVANDISRDGAGFDTDTNIINILTRDQSAPLEFPLMSKRAAADCILNEIARLRRNFATARNALHEQVLQ